MIYHIHFLPHSDVCEAILITGDNSVERTYAAVEGLYFLSNESVSAAPSNPVWKNGDGSNVIFNNNREEGWRIGPESELASGRYYCKGKHTYFDDFQHFKYMF